MDKKIIVQKEYKIDNIPISNSISNNNNNSNKTNHNNHIKLYKKNKIKLNNQELLNKFTITIIGFIPHNKNKDHLLKEVKNINLVFLLQIKQNLLQ